MAPHGETPALWLGLMGGAAHRIGLNETAEAMAIVWSGEAFWSSCIEVATSAAGVGEQ